jgi:hypothetical protein
VDDEIFQIEAGLGKQANVHTADLNLPLQRHGDGSCDALFQTCRPGSYQKQPQQQRGAHQHPSAFGAQETH